MTNLEAVKILVTAAKYIPSETEGYAEALMRAVWALSMEETGKDD